MRMVVLQLHNNVYNIFWTIIDTGSSTTGLWHHGQCEQYKQELYRAMNIIRGRRYLSVGGVIGVTNDAKQIPKSEVKASILLEASVLPSISEPSVGSASCICRLIHWNIAPCVDRRRQCSCSFKRHFWRKRVFAAAESTQSTIDFCNG